MPFASPNDCRARCSSLVPSISVLRRPCADTACVCNDCHSCLMDIEFGQEESMDKVDLHSLPCRVEYDGEANVEAYFMPQRCSGAASGDAETSGGLQHCSACRI